MKAFHLLMIALLFGLMFASLILACGDDDDDDDDTTADDDDSEDDDDMADDDDMTDDDATDDDAADDDTTDDDATDDDATDDDATDDDDDATDDDDNDDDVDPTWDNFAEQFFIDYCTRCHASTLTGGDRNSAPIGIDYDTYALAVTNAAGAKTWTTDSTSMPVGSPKPTTGERATLGDWVDDGTPEN